MYVWKSLNIQMKETTALHFIAYFTKTQKTHTCIAYFNKEINIPFATPIPLLIKNTLRTFKYSSYSRGYHVYRYVCIPIIGDDSLTCEREEHNKNDKNAVAITWNDCFKKYRSCSTKLE